MLETLEYLKKGGRLTTAAAMLAQLLKIKPVLQIQGDKLDAFSKVRTVSQAKSVMINQARKDIVNKFGCHENGKGVTIYSVYSNNYEAALSFKEDFQQSNPKLHRGPGKEHPEADGIRRPPAGEKAGKRFDRSVAVMADIAASVLAKLKNKAKAAGISYQQCLQLFFQEEFHGWRITMTCSLMILRSPGTMYSKSIQS